MLKVLKVLAVLGVLGVLLVPATRVALLRRAGEILTTADAVSPADCVAMDAESGEAGVLMLADLYRAQPSATIALLRPAPTHVDDELTRRGVRLPDVVADALTQLGVPKRAIVAISAGEGGTTESTAALAEWARAHRGMRVLAVVGPSHGRRYRRALSRAWPRDLPAATVVTTPYSLFKADNWWESRTTLREGLVEFEKLALDYAAHPF